MFDFIRKESIWDACDKGYLDELQRKKMSYQLKIAQDLAIYRLIRGSHGQNIAEIGGGNSRVLERLALDNNCTNIDKFEGKHQGPSEEVSLSNVNNIHSYIGEFDDHIPNNWFDVIFSISVVEHIKTDDLNNFFEDMLRILKPGGKFYHAIDMYLEKSPSKYHIERFQCYKNWVMENKQVVPINKVVLENAEFDPSMASNPDNILYAWNTLAPSLSSLRSVAQNVSLIVGGEKIAV